MTHLWDEFSKSLAEPLPCRESLRRVGIFLAGAVLSPLGLQSASAGRQPKPQQDLCKSFCKCHNKKQQDQCLKACSACGNDPRYLGGDCGNYFCCGPGLSRCDNYCVALGSDPYNCGACGYKCDQPGPDEYVACINGRCEYACAEGADYCNGRCTFLGWDSWNCGECGYVCPDSAPYCNQGTCQVCPAGEVLCGDQCVDLVNDPDNCGACGNVCGGATPYCGEGHCTDCGGPTVALCYGICIGTDYDSGNCGGCGIVCPEGTACMGGACQPYCTGCGY